MDETLAERVGKLADEWEADHGILSPDSRYTRDVMVRELRALLDTPAPAPVGDVEGLRDLLRGAKCACGHDAEIHSGMLGCNNEDYTAPPTACECDEDWVGAVAPLLAAFAAAQRAEALREAAKALPGFDDIRTHGDAANWLRRRANREARP